MTGCALYGFAYVRSDNRERWIGWLMLLWATFSVPAWLDEIFRSNLGSYFFWMGLYFQPLARAFIGIWLFKTAKDLALPQKSPV